MKTNIKTVSEVIQEQYEYLKKIGGVAELQEADDRYNNLNQELIKSYANEYGEAWLGRINCCSKNKPMFVKYIGQKIYNFDYDFCIPKSDEQLSELLNRWNNCSPCEKLLRYISNRIKELGGIEFLWT